MRWVDVEGIARANLIDATPIGANVRSTVATYADIHDELRRAFARTPEAKAAGYKAGAFSYNTGALRCPTCDGTGSISLDVQFLPDVEIVCPACRGSRYADAASHIHREGKDGSLLTLPQLMDMSVDEALDATVGLKKVQVRLQTLHDLAWVISRLVSLRRRFRAARRSALSLRARWAACGMMPCSCSMSPRSACTRSMFRCC